MIQIRRNFWVVLILLLASIGAAVISGRSIYYRLIYLWSLIIVTSFIWTLLSLRGLNVNRHARTMRQQVGQIFEERFDVSNKSRFPRLWVVLKDQSALPGNSGSRVLTWIGGRQQRTYLSYTWLTRRGQFPLGPTVLESGDLFGLFVSQKFIPASTSILVTPYIVGIQAFPAPPGLLPGGRALQRKTHEVTPYAAGVREYVFGDSLNRIHWQSTARRDRLMVKEFEQDPQADVWIFIDAQQSIQAALPEVTPELKGDRLWLWRSRPDEVTLPPSTIEYAVSVAASLSQFYIQQGRAVGLVSAGQNYMILPAERGERQLGKIVDTLAFLQADGELPMIGLTAMQASHLPRGSTVVIITPSIQKSIAVAAADLAQRTLQPVVVFLDPSTFGGTRSTAGVAAALAERGITSIQIANGADLKSTLEQSSLGQMSAANWWSAHQVSEETTNAA
ncbi:MAG TPA: DUF58 domain-containing protein [Anaerolineaceae bacterium]|nr:DUF58 domain-containing protein [Anaerolineaceae bacterium]